MDFKKVSTQIMEPDRKLAAIVGDTPRTRGEIIRKFWDYINERGLQDTDRRMINADKELQLVLGGKKQVNIFQVAALVSKHLKKPRDKKAVARKAAKPAAAKKSPKPSSEVKKPAPPEPNEEKAVVTKPEKPTAEKAAAATPEAGKTTVASEKARVETGPSKKAAPEKTVSEKTAAEMASPGPAPETPAAETPTAEIPAPEIPAPEENASETAPPEQPTENPS